jgi:hypothetical protein
LEFLFQQGDLVVCSTLMDERDDGLAGHIAAENENIRAVKFPRVEKLTPANVRTVNIRGKE